MIAGPIIGLPTTYVLLPVMDGAKNALFQEDLILSYFIRFQSNRGVKIHRDGICHVYGHWEASTF